MNSTAPSTPETAPSVAPVSPFVNNRIKPLVISFIEGLGAALLPVIVAYTTSHLANILTGTALVVVTGLINAIYDNFVKTTQR